MKSNLIACGILTLAAASLFAGSEQIIKQRAKDLRDQNNAAQGVAPASTQPTQPSQAGAVPTAAPALTPQQQSMLRLRAEIDGIRAGSQVTAEQKQRLAANMVGVAQGPGKPTLQTTRLLADNLAAGLVAKPLSAKSRERLLQNLQAAINPGTMKEAQLNAIADDIQLTFVLAGVDRKEAVKIADGVKAITAEVRKPAK